MKLPLAICALVALPAYAEPIQLTYTGTVSRLTYADCQTLVNGSCTSWSFTSLPTTNFFNGATISVGNDFSGSFVYDAAAPLTAISSDGFQAVHLNAVSEANFQGGEVTLPSPSLSMAGMGSFSVVNNRNGYDSFFVQGLFSQGDWFASVNFHLQDSTGTVFNGFDVPRSLDFNDFNANVFNIGFLRRSDGDQVQLSGRLTSAAFSSSVPEPNSLALLLAAVLAGLGVTRRSSSGIHLSKLMRSAA